MLNVFKLDAATLVFGGDVHGGFGKVVDHAWDAVGEFGNELHCGRVEKLSDKAGLLKTVLEIVFDHVRCEGAQASIEGDALT